MVDNLLRPIFSRYGRLKLPTFALKSFEMLGPCAIPMSILLIGSTIYDRMHEPSWSLAAIPAVPGQGLEYRASKYEVQIRPVYESIFSWITRSEKTKETRHLVTAYVPIPADGSVNKIFTGAKDYFLLSDLSENLQAANGRSIDIVDLINFSN